MRDALGNVQSVLVLGGESDIARATVRRLVGGRARTVVLAAPRPETLVTTADALRAAGATTVEVVPFDAAATDSRTPLIDDLFDRFGDFDVVLVAFGAIGDRAAAEHDADPAIARVESLDTIPVAVSVAQRMSAQGHGTIVALWSGAGERIGRADHGYGSPKAGRDGSLRGLGKRLAGTGVKVMIVRSRCAATTMTEGMRPAWPSTTADAVADAIVAGLARGSETVWVPGALRYVMPVLHHLPRPMVRRLAPLMPREER